MDADAQVTVRMFGLLHAARRAAGLPTTVTVSVPTEGTNARQLALDLDLDLAIIEGVFVNRTVYDLGTKPVSTPPNQMRRTKMA
jgi:hypothetical protein